MRASFFSHGKIGAADQLAHYQKVHAFRQFSFDNAGQNELGMHFYQAQFGEKTMFLAIRDKTP